MENSSLTSFIAFSERHNSKILLIEKISIIAIIVGTIMYHWHIPNYSFLVVLGAILGALSYFILSYKIIETENLETTGILNSIGFINFMYKLTYYSLAISCMAMLDLVINFKNGNPIILVAGITLICTFLISLFTRLNDRSVIYNTSFYFKIIIMLLLLSYLGLRQYGKV